MAQAAKIADRTKAKAAKSKGSDELECAHVSSSDEERPPSKKTKKKSAVSEQRAANVINQFTFS